MLKTALRRAAHAFLSGGFCVDKLCVSVWKKEEINNQQIFNIL
jgi:hypothetical protein